MWSKKRDEEPARLPVPPAARQAVPAALIPMSPSPMEAKKEATPVSSMPPADRQAVPAAPVPMPPSPMEAKKEATPVSSMPLGGRMEPENLGSATIGKAVKVVGQIYSKEDLFVDGYMEGTVEALEHKLTIGPNGKVHATVKAREVAVLGTIQGDVEATDKIEIRKGAKLVGNIKTARIIIEDGAYFKGGIDVVKAEPKAAPKAQQSAPAPPSAGPVGQLVYALKGTPEGRR